MKTRIYLQQTHGANYPGAAESMAALVERGLEARVKWLARAGLDLEYHGSLVQEPDYANLSVGIEDAAADLKWENSRTMLLGSDHSLTLSVLRGLNSRRTFSRLGLIHFDAHSDLEEPGKGNPHASVISEIAGLTSTNAQPAVIQSSRIVQIGIRDFSREELQRSKSIRRVITCNQVAWNGIAQAVDTAYRDLVDEVDALYVTFDLDVLSPSEMPAVNTPKAGGGITLSQASAALGELYSRPKVIGGDLVEYNPRNDTADGRFAAAVFELVASACGYQRLLSSKMG